jgi:hypothetical protein
LGPSYNKYFPFQEINSVRSPNFEDIFHQRDRQSLIHLTACLAKDDNSQIEISFQIKSSGNNYVIELLHYGDYDHKSFNRFFNNFPRPIDVVYSLPVSNLPVEENFTTNPFIREAVTERRSSTVFRNRLYRILKSGNQELINQFHDHLSFILFNNQKSIKLESETSIDNDRKVVIKLWIAGDKVPKDVSLLGSGTLQIIEILLNLMEVLTSSKDLRLILLDEPDSHIHRDIQLRLIGIIHHFSGDNQIFISTHNEAMIRSVMPQNLFHLDGRQDVEIFCVDKQAEGLNLGGHFKGIVPSKTASVIKSIGGIDGLELIDVIESDRLFFVEGEDDARSYQILLDNLNTQNKKYAFWVLGGVSEVFSKLNSYKNIFSLLKGKKSLWDKSVFIFDKDDLSIEHKNLIVDLLSKEMGIPIFSMDSYTFESSLFTDLDHLTDLLKAYILEHTQNKVDTFSLSKNLTEAYFGVEVILNNRFNDRYFEEAYNRYKNSKLEKLSSILSNSKPLKIGEAQLMTLIRNYHKGVTDQKTFYELMNKNDVEFVLNQVLNNYKITFSVENNLIELIKFSSVEKWNQNWDFLKAF